MNTIKVIYDKGIQSLYNSLNRKHFVVDKKDKKEMVISIRDREEYEEFIEIIKKYLIKEKFNRESKRILYKKGYGESFIKDVLDVEIIKGIHKVDYFSILTEILLLEYFKNMSTINIWSFMTLNMKEFEDEALIIIEMIEKYMKESMEFEEDNENESEILDLDELITSITQAIKVDKLNLEDFSEIKIDFFEYCNIEIIDVNGNIHTMKSIGELIGIDILHSYNEKEYQHEMAILFTCIFISIMKTKKIYMKKSQKEFKDMIISYFTAMGLSVEIEEV